MEKPEVGRIYITSGIKRQVCKIMGDRVYYYKAYEDKPFDFTRTQAMAVCNFTRSFCFQDKPLDHAFKILDKQLCNHKNTKREHFFSAKVYITCVDCGQPLN